MRKNFMTTDLKDIANSYFKSWKARDFETLQSLLAHDVTFVGALGEANDADECIKGIKGLSNIVTDIVIQHMWADEFDVITWFELHTTKTASPLSVVNWSHVENGKINKIRVTFDPRPLM
jgi:hypothetical protein